MQRARIDAGYVNDVPTYMHIVVAIVAAPKKLVLLVVIKYS